MSAKAFLKALGLTVEQIDKVETGTFADVLADLEANQEQVFLAKNKKKIEDAAKEEVQIAAKLAAENSLKQKLKTTFSLDVGNVKDAKIEDVFDALKTTIDTSSKATDEALKTKVNELTTKVAELNTAKEKAETDLRTKDQEVENFKTEFSRKQTVSTHIDSLLDGIVWATEDPVLIAREKRIIKKELEALKVLPEGTEFKLLNSDDTQVLTPDGKSIQRTPSEFVNNYVDTYKLRRLSGGSGGGEPSGGGSGGGAASGGNKKIDYSGIIAEGAKMGYSEKEALEMAGIK
jgi:hypothetical protein